MRAEDAGFQRAWWNATRSSRVIFSTVPRRPCTGRPYGCSGPNASIGPDARRQRVGDRGPAARSRRAAASSRARLPAPGTSRSARRRRRCASAGARLRFSTSRPTRALSRPAPPVSVVPRSASASSTCSALRVFVPRSMTVVVSCATPALPAGSPTAPARVTSVTFNFGRSVRSSDQHLEPVLELRRLHRRRDERPIRAKRRLLRPIQRQGVRRARRLLGMEADDGAVAACSATRRRPRAPPPA